MAQLNASPFADKVVLELGGKPFLATESFEVKTGVLVQPNAFSINLGLRGIAADLKKQYPKNTPFRLLINNAVQFEGALDGARMRQSGANGTTIAFRGRDLLAPLLKTDADADESFEGKTIQQIVEAALKAGGVNYDGFSVDNAAARKTRTGASLLVFKEPIYNPKAIRRLAKAHVGESWYAFVRRHLDHAGLMLWAGPGRQVIVSRPNANQSPTWRLRRGQRGTRRITDSSFDDEATERFSRVKVFGKQSGRSGGRKTFEGEWTDPEITDGSLKTFRDVEVGSNEEATFYARRKVAEYARAGFRLSYELSGLSFPTIAGPDAIWTPDTMIDLDDEEYDLRGNFWIESVIFKQSPTTSTITLLRPEYLVFGAD